MVRRPAPVGQPAFEAYPARPAFIVSATSISAALYLMDEAVDRDVPRHQAAGTESMPTAAARFWTRWMR